MSLGCIMRCERRELNPHPLRDRILSPARLPVPPRSRSCAPDAPTLQSPAPGREGRPLTFPMETAPPRSYIHSAPGGPRRGGAGSHLKRRSATVARTISPVHLLAPLAVVAGLAACRNPRKPGGGGGRGTRKEKRSGVL